MQTNAIKQLMNRLHGLKCENTDFNDFPLYFSKFPLYNVSGMRSVASHPIGPIFMFFYSTMAWNTHEMGSFMLFNFFEIERQPSQDHSFYILPATDFLCLCFPSPVRYQGWGYKLW